MEHFYDGQIKRYLTQFMRVLSNFSYKDAKGKLVQIPVRYGDMNRQVAQIMKKNSENIVQSAPFIACYIKGMDFARDRLQDPTYVSKMNIRERAFDENGNEYLNVQGSNYTVERLMPTPFNLQFTADIWTTNTDQKLQLLEQLLVLFNPSLEMQTSNNYIDWTSLSVLELTGMTFSSRSIPQGLEQDIDIASLNFTTPIWLTTPAKVKKLGVITKIITSIFDDPTGTNAAGAYSDPTEVDYFSGRNPVSIGYTTLGNLGLLILDNTAKLIPEGSNGNGFKNWMSILDAYPGKFTASLSQIRLIKPDGNEIVGYISLDPTDDSIMHVNFDQDTVPMDTLISDANNLNPRGTVDAVINPETFNPRPYLPNGDFGWPAVDARYLILEDILSDSSNGPEAWKNEDNSPFAARANDIIQWDGNKWNVIFNSANNSGLTYITNARTGVQYAWDGSSWMKSYEGVYTAGQWRLVL
jgi:hypothetical protein